MYDVKTSISYPEKLSQGLLILRLLFGFIYVSIPHGFVLLFRGIASGFLTFLAWWAILFTGKYPQKWHAFNVGTSRWRWRLRSYFITPLGTSGLTDVYPPFTGMPKDEHPATFDIVYPEKSSRGLLLLRTFFGVFYVLIPHGLILLFRILGAFFVTIAMWWAILFTGKAPENMFNFVVGTFRWMNNVGAYMYFLTDKYPPFTGKADA